MVQKTSPFIEANYGWNLGESGWNSGMDENLLKFSYMLDNGVDGVVTSLPQTPINGTSYYLTTDNRFYFVVDGTYYSSPCPKWFTFKLKTTGQKRVYDGSGVITLPSDIDVSGTLNSLSNQITNQYNNLSGRNGSSNIGYAFDATALSRTVFEKINEIVSVRDFGKVSSDNTDIYTKAYNKIINKGSGILFGDSSGDVSGTIGGNSITPTLVRSDRPTLLGLYDGTNNKPCASEDPALWVQKYVSYDSGTDRYRQTPLALFEVLAKGSSSSTNQNDGSWAGLMGNARLKNSNVGTAQSPVSDGYGSLTGLVGFAKADYFPGEGTAVTGLWGYASTPTLSDTDLSSFVNASFATIGVESNLQIDHSDVGYREYVAGVSSTVGFWGKNYRTPNTGLRNWNFGMVLDGTPVDGDYSNNSPANWNGFWVGAKIDDIKQYGILFGRRFATNSVLIKAPDSYSISGTRPLAFADTGDNPFIWSQYTGTTFNNGMMWQNGGTLYFRKNASTYEMLLNNERFFVGTVTNQVNRFELYGAPVNGAPALVAAGTDANISLELRTKGTGRVLIGSPYTTTSTATIAGYLEIKDNTGVTRKVAVIS